MTVRTRYSHVAMLLHWVIAAMIVANLVLGWRTAALSGMAQFQMFQLHKSFGITVLVLSVARLGWRVFNPPPAMPAMPRWQRHAATATHWLFYLMMIGMPLTGWAIVSVSPYNLPTLLWGAIPWPHLGVLHALPIGQRAQVEAAGSTIHVMLAYGGAGLIALHVAAALKHQFVDRDGLLGRMIPGLRTAPSDH